jgi:hypothetical protein
LEEEISSKSTNITRLGQKPPQQPKQRDKKGNVKKIATAARCLFPPVNKLRKGATGQTQAETVYYHHNSNLYTKQQAYSNTRNAYIYSP